MKYIRNIFLFLTYGIFVMCNYEIPSCGNFKRDVTEMEGSSVMLPCTVMGSPKPEFRWQKIRPEGKLSSRFVQHNKGLSIRGLQKNDSGKYQVTLKTQSDQIYFAVTLKVLSLDSIKPENYVSVKEGQRAVVECGKLRAQTPRDTFEWMKGSIDLSLNNRYSIDSNGSLVIKVTKSSDSGAYTCASKRRAPDGSSSSTNVAMYLSVKYPPKITSILPYIEVYENADAVLPCSATGNPGVTFRWLFPTGEEIKQTDKFEISTNGSLVILNVQISDVRNYTCAPYNKIGSGRYGYTQLKILMPPEFINRPKDTNLSVQEGQSISLDCSASGQPKPNISWTHNTKLEHDNKKYSFNSAGVLTIKNIHGSDFGIYRCFVESVAGILYREYNVTVIGKPGVPSSFGVRTKDNIAYVYWTPSYNGGSFQSFEIWYRRADDNDYNWETLMPSGVKKKHSILLKGPATVGGHGEAYFFCVRARNNKGYSDFTNIYKVLKSSKLGEENVAEDVGQFITDLPLAPYSFTVNMSEAGYILKWKHMMTPGRPAYAGYSIEYRTANTSTGWKEFVPKQRARRSTQPQGKQEKVSIAIEELPDVKHPLEFQIFAVAANNVKSTGTKPKEVIKTGMPGASPVSKESDDLIPPIVLAIIFGLFVIVLIISLYCFCRRRKRRYHASRNEKKMIGYNKEHGIEIEHQSIDSTDNGSLLSPKFGNNDSPRRFHLRACPALKLGTYNQPNMSNGSTKDDVFVLLEPNENEKRVCTCNKKYMTLDSRDQKTKREKRKEKKGLYKSTSSPSVLLMSDIDGSSIDPSELLDEEDYDISDIEKDDVVELNDDKKQRYPALNRKNFKDSYDQFCRDGIDGSRRRLSSNEKTEVDKNMDTGLVGIKDIHDASSENSATESDRMPSPKIKTDLINDKTYDGKSSGFGDGSNSTSDSESIHQEIMDKPTLLRPNYHGYAGHNGYISDSGYRRDGGYASDISTRSSPLDYVGRHKYLPPSQRHNLNYSKPPQVQYYSEDEGTRHGTFVSPRPVAPPSYNQAMVDIERMSEKNEVTDSEDMFDNLLEMERQLGITLDDSLDSDLNVKTMLPPRPYSNPKNYGLDTGYMSDAPVVLGKNRYSDREKSARCAQLLNEFKSNKRTEITEEEEEEEMPVLPPTDRCRSVIDSVTEEPRVPPVLRRSNSVGSSSVYKEWLV
ncbi:protein turtle homolog A-like isoform X3 [Hydractinia symbiolongicarpus]|uniref:protein turtle homolog A-like isoform X3 n=1 Tax=Hydractinia symbiolongicarpus TaxID=13093 RepID=UPI002551A311|nr:protein turtle homolog A-like isoform X3 [Hydractinia symbiolongicarpus]